MHNPYLIQMWKFTWNILPKWASHTELQHVRAGMFSELESQCCKADLNRFGWRFYNWVNRLIISSKISIGNSLSNLFDTSCRSGDIWILDAHKLNFNQSFGVIVQVECKRLIPHRVEGWFFDLGKKRYIKWYSRILHLFEGHCSFIFYQ